MIDFRMSLDPASVGEIARFYGFETFLQPEVQEGLRQISSMLAERAQAKTWEVFQNPTGQLAGTIGPDNTSPYEAQVVVLSTYGHRREYSFKGPDALGRMFPNDPAQPYLGPTLQENQHEALGMMEAAVNLALGRIAAG